MDQQIELVKEAMILLFVSGCWLEFQYSKYDKTPPWRWVKVIKYNSKLYGWTGFNPDKMLVYYKEISESEIAVPHKL